LTDARHPDIVVFVILRFFPGDGGESTEEVKRVGADGAEHEQDRGGGVCEGVFVTRRK
jgi:hypothetical protein